MLRVVRYRANLEHIHDASKLWNTDTKLLECWVVLNDLYVGVGVLEDVGKLLRRPDSSICAAVNQ